MRLFTLDRLGLVKTIEFNSKTAKPAPSKKLQKKVKKSSEVNDVEKVERLCIDSKVKENICKIFMKSAKQLLFVTVRNKLFTFCLESGDCVCVCDGGKDNSVAFESLKASYSSLGFLLTCSSSGVVTYFDVRDMDNVKATRVSLGQDQLNALAIHPQFPNIFATGGNERELCIWDISQANQTDNTPDMGTDKLMPIWKARNVPNDSLDMRVRVHVTAIVWMNKENHTDVAIATAYSQIRVYNTKKQKRPILDFQKCGTHPIKTLVHTRNNEFVYSDTMGNVTAVNAATGIQTGRFKGIAGAVIDLYACEKYPYLVTVSLDRRCKVFEELGQRRIIKDIYLKQQLVNVIVDENGDDENVEAASSENGANGEEHDDEMWNGIAKASEETANTGEKRKSH